MTLIERMQEAVMTGWTDYHKAVIVVPDRTFYELEKEFKEQFATNGYLQEGDGRMMLGATPIERFPIMFPAEGFLVMHEKDWNEVKQLLQQAYVKQLHEYLHRRP